MESTAFVKMEKSIKSIGSGYIHRFGIVDVSTWGPPFLIIEDTPFNRGERIGYNYRRLGVEFNDKEESRAMVNVLNKKYNLPRAFSDSNSQDFLLMLQNEFPGANIAKNKKQ